MVTSGTKIARRSSGVPRRGRKTNIIFLLLGFLTASATLAVDYDVATMSELYFAAESGTILLAEGEYKCSEGVCGGSSMLDIIIDDDLFPFSSMPPRTIKCYNDNASCVLDGESSRIIMELNRSMGPGEAGEEAMVVLQALTFKDDQGFQGGGGSIRRELSIEIVLCVFTKCRATSRDYGGGAIFLEFLSVLNLQASSFASNTPDSGKGGDIYIEGDSTVTIHNICPSPYSSNTPTQGKTRMRRRRNASYIESFIAPKLT